MASKLERARAGVGRLRARVKGAEPLRAMSAFGGGAIVGTLEQRGVVPTTVVGLPTKPVVAVIAYAVAAQSSIGSTTHTVLSGMADGVLGAYGYAAGKARTLIAGDGGEEIDAEEEVVEVDE